jgi:hypothetical protein
MQIIATFEHEKDTPGSHRYKCVSGDEGVTTIYIRKAALRGERAPKRLQLTLTPTD